MSERADRSYEIRSDAMTGCRSVNPPVSNENEAQPYTPEDFENNLDFVHADMDRLVATATYIRNLEATAQEQDEISVHLLDSNMELLNENNSLLTEKETLEATVARLSAPVTDEEASRAWWCGPPVGEEGENMKRSLQAFLDRRKAGDEAIIQAMHDGNVKADIYNVSLDEARKVTGQEMLMRVRCTGKHETCESMQCRYPLCNEGEDAGFGLQGAIPQEESP